MTTGRPISEFEAWMASGGEARAGLPAGSLATLSGSLVRLKSTMNLVFGRLRNITDAWSRLVGDAELGDNAAKELIHSVMGDLSDASRLLSTAQGEASAVTSDANLANGLLDRTIAEDLRRIEAERAEIARLEEHVRSLNTRLQNIRNEVEGWEGFWKGMAIVFSLGIYDPMGENRRKIVEEIGTTNAKALSARETADSMKNHQTELQACLATLDRITGLESRVSQLAGDVAEGSRQARDALVQAEMSQARDGGRLGPIYAGLAAHRIGNLVTWAANSRPFE